MAIDLPPDLPPREKPKPREERTEEETKEANRRHGSKMKRRPRPTKKISKTETKKAMTAYDDASTHKQHEAKVNVEPKFDFAALVALDDTPKSQAAQDLVEVMKAIFRRQSESLKLYHALPTQERFHKSTARVRLVKGSNRAGKTLCSAIEVARAVTNSDPYKKYPKAGICFIVGDDWAHHGQTIYPKLFLPGAFKVIRDRETQMLRAFRPWDEEDLKRAKEAKPSAPLIPKRLIADIAWHKPKENIPKVATLKTGWQLYFFSGTSDPPQGADVDLVWPDEEIPNEKWFPEMNSRIVDRHGKLIWSATPEIGTDEFYELCSRAEEQELLPESFRQIELFNITLRDNPHITEQAKSAMESALSDEMRLVKVEGQFALSGRKVYQEYSKLIHGIEHFEIPSEWTNFAAIDPGVQICAVLFGSCPKPEDVRADPYDFVVWDELYIPRCDAKKFADRFARKVEGRNFEDFIIDTRGSRVTEAGSGLTIYEQFARALKDLNVRSRRSGSSFTWGSDLLRDGILMVKSMMRQQEGSKGPRLRVMYKRNDNGIFEPTLPNFAKEMERYRYKQVAGITLEDTDERRDNHLMACLRYLIMRKPKYRKAEGFAMMDPAVAAFFKDQERDRGKRHVHFGPAGGA